jgi:hypothetical protein
MITAPCDYCGIAWVGGGINYAFSVVTSDCLETFTSAHELGHNQVRKPKMGFYVLCSFPSDCSAFISFSLLC